LTDATVCIEAALAANLAGGGRGSTVAMVLFFLIAVICASALVGYVWRGRRARPFSALQFDNPIYRRTTEDPDNFEFGMPATDNSLGAFPSDVINPPLLPSRLILNQPNAPPTTGASNDFYHPSNYAYDQPLTPEVRGNL
jgi:hypothetical protein